MGSIYNRGTRSRPNWWIKWVGQDGRPQYEGIGKDRDLAEKILKKIEADIVTERHGLPHSREDFPTFREEAERWLKSRSAVGKDGLPAVRSWKDDRARLTHYLYPFFGDRRLSEIRKSDVRAFIEFVRPQLAAQSIRNCLAILSRFFNDWNGDNDDRGAGLPNPVAQLDRATRRKIGKKWDPKKTPFIRSKDQIREVYLCLPEMSPSDPWRAMFGVGVFAGLRTDEIRALRWSDIDFTSRLILVLRTVHGPIKDDECRSILLTDTLAFVLTEWKSVSQPADAQGWVFPSTGHRGTFVKDHSMRKSLGDAIASLGMPNLTWYQATRHTFGSHWVMDGGSLEKLRVMLGHSTTEVTLRYAHLVPGRFTDQERGLVGVSLTEGKVLNMTGGAAPK